MNMTAKRMVIMLVAVFAVLGTIFIGKFFMGRFIQKMIASQGMPVQTVSTTVAKKEDWQPSISAVGSLRAVKGADLALEVPGIVEDILFESGQDVKAGTILLRLRAEDDEAKLRSLEAGAQLAATTFERNKKQFEFKAISQAALDVDAANLKSARAAVEEQRAMVNKKVVTAPFAGRIGVRHVDVGQYLQPGTPVVTLQSLDPIYADFYLPLQQVNRLKAGQKVTVKVDAEATTALEGEISAINPKVETSSRNVLVRATLKNPTRRLLPGASVVVDIGAGAPQKHITLPQTAITYNPYGDTVYLAVESGKDDKGQPKLIAKQTFVTTGPTRGDQIAVFEGIKEGDVVVTAGQLKLQNDTPLAVNNSIQPVADPDPKPVDE
ncbi:MAG: efflux RND transporter periplasmic adaptor subunit [Rhodospirillaceae bacterium]|nr:efflux RND transporter periplasmic adaptor subunit [Rhodospirillaceae bacterium]